MAKSSFYQIRVRGHVSSTWANRFEGFVVSGSPDGDSILTGRVVDQAALHAVIRRVQSLGMTLVSVCEVREEHHETENE